MIACHQSHDETPIDSKYKGFNYSTQFTADGAGCVCSAAGRVTEFDDRIF